MKAAKTRDGDLVVVGEEVFFKSDTEQYGYVKEIRRSRMGGGFEVVITAPSCEGFHGDYIGGQEMTVQPLDRCWIE